MESCVAVIAIIAESTQASAEINALLHEYSEFIIGRMGLPYRARNVNIITIALDAPQDAINALSGKMGRIAGVSAKALYSGVRD